MTTHLDPQVKAIFDEIVAHAPELGPTPTYQLAIAATESGRHRPWLTLAAATIAVAGLGGVAFVVWPDTEAPTAEPPSTPPFAQPSAPVNEPSATGPALEPTLFPALDDVPAGLSATATVQRVAAGPVLTEALLARPVNGTITDTVAITVQAEPFDISPMAGHPSTEAEVLGEPASVYNYGSNTGERLIHVTWGTGPYFLASGSAPLDFLARLTADAFHTTHPAGAQGAPGLSFGQLPAGFEVIAPPRTVGHATLSATLSIADNYDISVGTRNPVVAMSQAGPLRSIDVAGRPGWTFLSTNPSQDIAWQVDESTYAYLKVNDGTDSAGALELANNITFLEWDEWLARYPPVIIPADPTNLTTPSHPS